MKLILKKMDIERPKIVQMLLQSIHAQHGSDVPKSFKLEPPNFVIQLRVLGLTSSFWVHGAATSK